MAKTTTSLRLDDDLRANLAAAAANQGVTVSALIQRLLTEGLIKEKHPGIIFNDGSTGRRAAVMGTGADVWEIISIWRYVRGTDAERRAYLENDYGYKKWQINAALSYATEFRDEIEEWIAANERAIGEFERLSEERKRLLA